MVAMETSSHVDSDISYRIVARQILYKIAKFGGVCFNIKKKIISVQSRRQNPPPPGIKRVKEGATCHLNFLIMAFF